MGHEDQDSTVVALVRARRPGQIIAVASGKGGVGKSNISAGLAILLASAGARVALVDSDIGLGNLDVLLGVAGGPTLSEVLAGRRTLRGILTQLPSGVRLASGSTGPAARELFDGAGRAGLLDGLTDLQSDHDTIVLDCGSGIGPEVMEFCALADHVVVVTTPEPTARTDAYSLLKAAVLDGHAGRLSLLVNFVTDHQEAKAAYSRIASVAGQFLAKTVYDAGYVVTDPKVPAAVRQRRPFVLAYPHCPASRCLAALARKLRPKAATGAGQPRGTLLRRITRWFG